MMHLLRRLRSVSRRELAWRASTFSRVQCDRWIAAYRPARWRRDDLWPALAPDMSSVRRLASGDTDWLAVHRELSASLRSRPTRFVLDPADLADVRRVILSRWPDASRDAARRGQRVLAGEYDVLGYHGLSFGDRHGRVDWHLDPVHRRHAPRRFWADIPYLDPQCGDHKIIWEFNRHQHWLALGRALWLTGDPRYGGAIVAQLEDWLEANPPLVGINWASMLELGLRTLSWVWALHFLLAVDDVAPNRPWIVDLLVGLTRQLSHVERNLSYYFSPNTHLTGEALALYVAGSALPELAASGRWRAVGRSILLDELDRQVLADGGHVERSTHYHRYTLDFYLMATLVARQSGDAEAVDRFTTAVNRLADFQRAIADDQGCVPTIGDDDGGMLWPMLGCAPGDVRPSLALAAGVVGRPDLAPWGAAEEAYWVGWSTVGSRLGATAPADPLQSQLLPNSGYVVMRDSEGSHLVFDVGPHGYLNGGHAHADALAITLTIHGRPFLVDPGTATYTTDPALRDLLRSSVSHNTLTLDGRSSSEPAGPFQWRTMTDASVQTWRGNQCFAWAEGSHNGYDAAPHRRNVVAGTNDWLIVDEVLGSGAHRAELHWHFEPAWTVCRDRNGRLRATHRDGTVAWLLHEGEELRLLRADEESRLGWYSPVYGSRVPASTATISRTMAAPFVMVTWIGVGGSADAPPVLERVPAQFDPAGTGLAVRVHRGTTESLTLVRPSDLPRRDPRSSMLGVYRTDARLLRYTMDDGRLVSLHVADATHVQAIRSGWLSMMADQPVSDLAIAAGRNRIELWSSAPPGRLQLQGAMIRDVDALRLNGRELPITRGGASETVTVPSTAWRQHEDRRIRADAPDIAARPNGHGLHCGEPAAPVLLDRL